MRVLCVVAAVLALAGCTDNASSPPADVVATDHAFTPEHLEVKVGASVSWINAGQAPHTVSIPRDQQYVYDEEFEAGERVEYTFDEPGEYRVVCTYHPGMEMTVNVA